MLVLPLLDDRVQPRAASCSPTRCASTAPSWAPDGAACRAGRQALLVLAHLRKGETYADLAGGFGVGTTTVYRYVREGARRARRAWRRPWTRRSRSPAARRS